MYNEDFWEMLDKLVNESEVIVDRPKGSTHPKYNFLYQVDYGYLKGTASMDGGGIDVWKGTDINQRIVAIICTVDMLKKDSEIKILIGCTPNEIVHEFHNRTSLMKGILINR